MTFSYSFWEKKIELKARAINAFIYFGYCQFIAKRIFSRETLIYVFIYFISFATQ